MTPGTPVQRAAWLHAIHDSIVRDGPSAMELQKDDTREWAPNPTIPASAPADTCGARPVAVSGQGCHKGWLVKQGGFVRTWKR